MGNRVVLLLSHVPVTSAQRLACPQTFDLLLKDLQTIQSAAKLTDCGASTSLAELHRHFAKVCYSIIMFGPDQCMFRVNMALVHHERYHDGTTEDRCFHVLVERVTDLLRQGLADPPHEERIEKTHGRTVTRPQRMRQRPLPGRQAQLNWKK